MPAGMHAAHDMPCVGRTTAAIPAPPSDSDSGPLTPSLIACGKVCRMFGISGPEFLVILGIALIVVGPRDLPRAMLQLARVVRLFRRNVEKLQSEANRMVRDLELDELRREVEQTARQAKSAANDASDTIGPVRQPLRSAVHAEIRPLVDAVATVRDDVGAFGGSPGIPPALDTAAFRPSPEAASGRETGAER